MIARLIDVARRRGLKSAVLSFVPHPAQFFLGAAYRPLYTETEQAALLAETGLDFWIPYPFDRALADRSANDFIVWLRSALRCRYVLAGEGFRFGRGREGTLRTLQTLGAEQGLFAEGIRHCQQEGEIISTSRIRRLLAEGDTAAAEQLLGRPYPIVGESR